MADFTLTTMNPNEIKTHETFKDLFPIKPEVLARIEADMKERHFQYDPSQPVVVATWKGEDEPVCIDGHTRIQAAINAGISEIPVWNHEFDTEDEALEYAIRLQANRRNMDDADILKCVMALDQRRPRGGDRRSDQVKSKPKACGIENSRSASAKFTADLLGISSRQVEKIRNVLDHADPETLEAVKDGSMSINQGYTATQEKRKAEKAANKDKKSQPVPSPEDAPEEADSCEDKKESFQDADAEDTDSPIVDEDTYEDTFDEAVLDDEDDQGPHDDTPEYEDGEAVEDEGAPTHSSDDMSQSDESAINPVMDTTVTIAPDLYDALKSLGGSIEVHVAAAIEAYLDSMGQPDTYDPEEDWKDEMKADIARDMAAKYDEEREKAEYGDGEYENQELLWAEPVTTGSAVA